MEIREISNVYTALPQCGAFLKAISDESVRHVFLSGLLASSAPVFFSAVAERVNGKKNSKLKTQNCDAPSQQFKTQNSKLKTLTAVFVLQDNEEAGYFYHDLTQILGTENVLFFPSSYRRAVKYGQRDAANEILRTETLSRLSAQTAGDALYVVTCPEALSELVVSKRRLDERTINIAVGDIVDFADLGRKMREFGFKEVEGIHSRTDFDLGNHQKFSGKKIQYFDPETGESYVPYVVETSIGVDRMFLQVMSAAYTEEQLDGGDSRVVLRLPAALAPVKVAVLPLVKKDGMPEVAQRIVDDLKYDYNVVYDEKDSVGKRYRRQDAIGTPFCVTVDGQTLEDGTVTIRHRDTMAQERVKIESLHAMVDEECSYRKLFRTLNL